jgi:hypothetical protein
MRLFYSLFRTPWNFILSKPQNIKFFPYLRDAGAHKMKTMFVQSRGQQIPVKCGNKGVYGSQRVVLEGKAVELLFGATALFPLSKPTY